MKRLFLSICFLLFANYLLAQQDYTYDVRGGRAIVTGLDSENVTHLVIHDVVPGTTTPITEIADFAFMFKSIYSVTIGRNVEKIGNSAFNWCENLEIVTFLRETAPDFGDYPFSNTNITTVNLPIGSTGYDILSSCIPNYDNCTLNYQIQAGDIGTLSSPLVLDANTTLENNGVLVIAQGGELVVPSNSNNDLGIIEVETSSLPKGWHFIGAPFAGYYLKSIVPRLDPSVCLFNYDNNAWNNSWATINDYVSAGEGFFAYSWSEPDDKIIFTNYFDGMYSPNANSDYDEYNYDYSRTPDYDINTEDFNVTRNLVESSETGYWMALANPYTFKLDVGTFLNDQQNIQGGVLYKLENESWTTTSEVINVTDGFFVSFESGGNKTAHFKTTQRATNAKASVEREFISLVMIDQEREIEVLFAQNEEAQEGYDRFDANKLFSPYEIAEPYFVTNNIALVKEEVNTLPYYATMNVRSYENKEVKFKANYIPQGYSLSLIDGEESIDLLQGQEYTTTISAGENANRFKVLIKKSVGLGEVEELEVEITNSNRLVNVSSTEEDLQIEVYNALGQKVFATKDRNFTLNNVSAGAYVVKAFNNKASKTQKIVVK